MRSTLEIIIAVKESQPATEEELRLALLVMSSIDHFVRHDLHELAEAVEAGRLSATWRAKEAMGTLERMFHARKQDPREWLGPDNIPGNPAYEQRYRAAMRLLEKVEQEQAQAGHTAENPP
jgi:hypothetical protein